MSLRQQLVTTLEQLQRLGLEEMIVRYHIVPLDIWYAFCHCYGQSLILIT
jgi:hypothetical protein